MKTNPDTLKVLVALAKNLRDSARNVRDKRKETEKDYSKHSYSKAEAHQKSAETMLFQASAMHHALYNAFFIAKKAAGRRRLW